MAHTGSKLYCASCYRFGILFEGCLNDDKLFIGNHYDLVSDFCKKFPNTKYCQDLRENSANRKLEAKMKKLLPNLGEFEKYVEKVTRPPEI